jgi:ketosteroid isomerase-like protein
MRKALLACTLTIAGGATLNAVAQSGPASAEKEVRAVEAARATALVHSDIAALDRIMADNATYVHASGRVDTKASYLDGIRSGDLHYLEMNPMTLHVRVSGNMAVVDGEYAVKAVDHSVQAGMLVLDIFVLTVYERRDGRWQQIAYQSTRDVAKTPLK